ncbi:L-ascorbate metabolism protein UlaG (beta-lactamase superfamily) [Nocardia sp. GAS34]|jgi:L-ascorbate metabolism protein UlaG (beta-lactamase superfamily)|uniref:MBL fold metallo-hydrolase n=1 Tax=unclassified Nocardia TaxID=2637762 RepID=UPI003D1F4436
MRLTKIGHACVRLDKDGASIVLDPGLLTPGREVVAGADAVLISHEHFDHFDPERLHDISAPIYTTAGVARKLTDLGDRVHVVDHGDKFRVAGFDVEVAGSKHHVAHPDYPPCDNIGFLVDGELFHPGDALTEIEVPTLLLPVDAPWLTVPAMLEYLRRVDPQRTFGIHDGLLNDWGLQVVDQFLALEADRAGKEIRRPAAGESIDL